MYAHSRPVHHAWHVMVRFCNRSCRCMHDEPAAACVVGRAPWSSFSGHAARPRWPTFHLRYLRPQQAPRDVWHAKLHCLERPRRMVALWGRKLEDPSRLFLQRYGTRSLYGASSRGIPVKKTTKFSIGSDDGGVSALQTLKNCFSCNKLPTRM